MVLRSYGVKKPTLGSNVYVDESAVVIGEVFLRDRSSVWPGAVLRADDDTVEVGRGSAMMDMSFAEAPKGRPVVVGDGCIVSHSARLHGCKLGDETLVGIGAIVLDGVVVGERSVIAAGCLVPPGTRIAAESFVMGLPAHVVRQTSSKDVDWLRDELKSLVAKAARYRSQS
jgi:carbonic anhydrase/acetyltransferase-like protein (isoleucine patch superfamily)